MRGLRTCHKARFFVFVEANEAVVAAEVDDFNKWDAAVGALIRQNKRDF